MDPFGNLQQSNYPYETTSNAYSTRETPTGTASGGHRKPLADRDP